jgi:hypothetical protein
MDSLPIKDVLPLILNNLPDIRPCVLVNWEWLAITWNHSDMIIWRRRWESNTLRNHIFSFGTIKMLGLIDPLLIKEEDLIVVAGNNNIHLIETTMTMFGINRSFIIQALAYSRDDDIVSLECMMHKALYYHGTMQTLRNLPNIIIPEAVYPPRKK